MSIETVGELRALLSELPPDMPVLLCGEGNNTSRIQAAVTDKFGHKPKPDNAENVFLIY